MKNTRSVISQKEIFKMKDCSNYPFRNLSLDDMEEEVWKEIPYFDDCFLISNYGRVKALPRLFTRGRYKGIFYTKERIIPQTVRGTYNHYAKQYNFSTHVFFTIENKNYNLCPNRLVYQIFINDVNIKTDKLKIRHKDGDGFNNKVDNLEAVDSMNIYYKSIDNDTRALYPQKAEKMYNQRGVLQYDLKGTLLNHFPSVTEAAKAMGSLVHELKKGLTNRVKQIKGFVIRYDTDTYNGEYANHTRHKAKKVHQYSVEGKLIKSYDSKTLASEETGISKQLISRSAILKTEIAKGFVWRYEGDIYEGEYLNKKKVVRKVQVGICQYEKDGTFIQEFESITVASKSVNLDAGSIRDCVRGKTITCGEYVWRYKDQPYNGEHKDVSTRLKEITQLDLQGNVIATFKSIRAAHLATGIPLMNIHWAYQGKLPNAGDFIWRTATKEELAKIPSTPLRITKESRPTSISISQYTKEGEKIATFDSISEASQATGVAQATIRTFIKNPKHVNGKFIWRKEGDIYQGELKDTEYLYESKTVTKYDLEGNKIQVFHSLKAAQKSLNASHSAVNLALIGHQKTAGGFIWQYGDGPDKIDAEAHFGKYKYINPRKKSVSCYDLDGNKKGFYESLGEASRETNVPYLGISYVVNGKNKTASKLIWIVGDGPDKIDTDIYFLKGEIKSITENGASNQ